MARWLDDIRSFFPQQVVQVLQRDAVERLGLRELLLEPELLAAVQPDVHLAAMLVALNRAIPERSREQARAVVRVVVTDLERRLAAPARQAVGGALHRAARTRRPRPGDVDWPRTILANLRHWQPEHRTLVPEKLIGFGRRGPQVQRDLVLAIDQSASMGPSVVYASVFAAALASVRALRTRVVAFATEVVDLTDHLADPVELLFGVQLGGGTDIARALRYCVGLVERPRETILVLISDLYEGGDAADLLRQAGSLAASGVHRGRAARAGRRRGAGVRPPAGRGARRPRHPRVRLHAGRASRTCWPPRSAATTWPSGRRARGSSPPPRTLPSR